jgi:hypothetical protein
VPAKPVSPNKHEPFAIVESKRAKDGCTDLVLANNSFCVGGRRLGAEWPRAPTLALSKALLLLQGQPNLAYPRRPEHTANGQYQNLRQGRIYRRNKFEQGERK